MESFFIPDLGGFFKGVFWGGMVGKITAPVENLLELC